VAVNIRSLTALSKAGQKPVNTIDVTDNLPQKGYDKAFSVDTRLVEVGWKPSTTINVRTTSDWNSAVKETVSVAE
jgi:hypothetical protein